MEQLLQLRRSRIAPSRLRQVRFLSWTRGDSNRRKLILFHPMPKIAVDAMGGDHAPGVVIEGAFDAVRDLGAEIVLVGLKEAVEQELENHPHAPKLSFVAAPQVVPMHEAPSLALRKKGSSMKVAFEMMRNGEVDAVVSAGNSGAMMAIGMFVMGTLSQVARPAILVVVPNLEKGTVIVDAGANVDCKPIHLVQFGLMGSIYAERILGVANPRVGVLSNGEEEGKGNELTRAANEQLALAPVNHIGYVEGRDLFNGKVDVVVCDGFTGNIALKTMEGVASFAGEILKGAFEKNVSSKLGYLMSRSALKEAYRRLDYAEYGGAPLIGLDGVAIVAHGGSNPLAIKNAIRQAQDAVDRSMNRHIADALLELEHAAGGRKEGLPRKLWHRLKSKIESIGEKTETPSEAEQRRRGGGS
jgi:glycerol-3-phosphate acyltransferase PlsX